MGWGARGSSHLWDGTLSITDGEILSVEPRFRGAEVVSPLEGTEAGTPVPRISSSADTVAFAVVAQANPNNVTPAMQGLMLRIRIGADAAIHFRTADTVVAIPATRLFAGAYSRNLGPIDSPAYTFHALPLPHRWQWGGQVPLGRLNPGETIYVRLRQSRGDQMAWTSPISCG